MDAINDVIYDGFSFADNELVLTTFNHMILPDRDNQIEKIAGRDGAVLVQSELGTKPIPMEGYYIGESRIDAENMYDTLTQMLNRVERPLYIPHAGGSRKFIATVQNAVIEHPMGLNRLTFSFEFIVPSGGSEDEEAVELIAPTVITNPTATIPLSVLGSIDARPLLTLEFNSVTGGTNKTVSIRNAQDYIGLQITRDWLSGDTLTIDSQNFQMYINGVLTEPNGRMPKWSAGAGSLYYSDSFTTRSVEISGEYTPKYL